MADDMALEMIIDEAEACRKIVNNSQFQSCPPDMKRVYLFLINSAAANLKQRRSSFGYFASGGLGAFVMAALDLYCRYKGWK
jgi:hypothetical protein